MPLVTCDISISIDGFAAGPDQTRAHPLGRIDENILHAWMFERRDENRDEVEAIVDAGAFIMGRHMFGPDRGDWDLDWHGWWGDDPPYHAPVFVLGHRERDELAMAGGTTFHFVTGGIHEALDRARAAAGDRNVAVAGGAATVNQYLAAGLIDELRLHVVPAVIGAGERLFDGVPRTMFEQVSSRGTSLVTHLTYRPRRSTEGRARA
ncbi:dihydrofolate reductase family protein [Agromyces aurantiacus]|uniref:Dihydrofolate reductase family protein n=1 Tax=Agromyces aurantiacus TaxID=165814 RepID=A0ABV9R1V1_9MICO|nr:dihydrofolate reductase family protein [Agromyces aurantiacus]MBM7505518.1 dihydrofolate reductase [Agromyces aurantiacus]